MDLLAERLRNGRKINQSDIFALENTFTFLLNSIGAGNLSVKERDIKKVIETYKKNLNDMYKADISIIRHELSGQNQYYEKQFYTGIGNDYYNIIWNVNKLQTAISRYHVNAQNFEIAKLIQGVDVHGITKDGLYRAKRNKEPIILAEIPYLNMRYTIVDGNHRLYTQNTLGNKFIRCYILKPPVHSTAMVNRLFRCLFEFNVFAGQMLQRGN